MSRQVNPNHSAEEFESFNSNYSKYDVSKKSKIQNIYSEEIAIESNTANILQSINRINQLINHSESLSTEINEKFTELQLVNQDVEENLKNISIPKTIPTTIHYDSKPKNQYLPTPTDDYDLGKPTIKTTDPYDIPSSPDLSFNGGGSDIDEVEIEINDKISRMVEKDYNSENILKLKNIVNSTFDVLTYGKDDNERLLMNTNDDIKNKSELLIDKLHGLVESFT